MTRAFSGLLILLKIILYSKYESRHTRRHEGSTLALRRPSILSSPDSPMSIALSMLKEESPEGHLTDPLNAIRSLRSACHYSGMKHACRSANQGTWPTRLQAPAMARTTNSDSDLILHCCCGTHAQISRSKTVQHMPHRPAGCASSAPPPCCLANSYPTLITCCTSHMRVIVHLPAHSVRHLMLVSGDNAERLIVTTSCAKDMLTH